MIICREDPCDGHSSLLAILNAPRRISYRRFYSPTLRSIIKPPTVGLMPSRPRDEKRKKKEKKKKNNKEGKHEYKVQGQNENQRIRYTGETRRFITKYFPGSFPFDRTNTRIFLLFPFSFFYIESRFVQRETGKRDKILINIDDAAKVDSRR